MTSYALSRPDLLGYIEIIRNTDLDRLRSGADNPDQVRDAFDSLGRRMAKMLLEKEFLTDTPDNVVVGVPRGGTPLYYAFLAVFKKARHRYLANTGKHADESKPLLQLRGINNKPLIIIDTVVHTGSTMERLIDLAHEQMAPSKFHLVSALSSEELQKLFFRYARKGVNINTYSFCTEREEEISNGKKILANLPDLGEIAEFLYGC